MRNRTRYLVLTVSLFSICFFMVVLVTAVASAQAASFSGASSYSSQDREQETPDATVTARPTHTPEPGDDKGTKTPEPGDDKGTKTPEAGDDNGTETPDPGDHKGTKTPEPGDDEGTKTPEPGDTKGADDSNHPAQFEDKWQKTDKQVKEGQSNHSWVWGNSIATKVENYAEGQNGQREVEYFDKARMELTNPNSGSVTNGLLVKELISGKLQLGNNSFESRGAGASVHVAGDDNAANPGPTYQSLKKVASLELDKASEKALGKEVEDALDQDGNVSRIAPPAVVKNVYYDNTLKHNIPDVFWNFMNQPGTVWDKSSGRYVPNNKLFNWMDVMGLPLTEAYWTTTLVGGQLKPVLVQAFERRVLTYTPSNPTQYQVEMGNVGMHYYTWRYGQR
ncbi:MAG TPA: hypothetical protein VH186_30920 [Chloroflexia bacterium]|nr:hypothetical protein [Chloroflexia bacterium]